MQPGFERRNGEIGVKGIGRRDDHRIQTATEQALDVRMDMLETVTIAQRLAHRGRRIRERDEREPLAFLPQIEGMLGLAHQASADQSNTQPWHDRHPRPAILRLRH